MRSTRHSLSRPVTGPRAYAEVDSPLGRVLLIGVGDALAGLYLTGYGRGPEIRADWTAGSDVLDQTATELAEYFAGTRTRFEVPLRPEGTPFQRQVWAALTEVPWGTTIGYGELAGRIGRPSAARAVGAANGANPISIIIPCHRVIGAAGALTGYGWGLERKAWLLAHEQAGPAVVEDKRRLPGRFAIRAARDGLAQMPVDAAVGHQPHQRHHHEEAERQPHPPAVASEGEGRGDAGQVEDWGQLALEIATDRSPQR